MKPRHKRAAIVLGGLVCVGLAAYFMLNALESSIELFKTPTEVVEGKAPKDRTFRIGGMVKEGSVQRDNLTVSFVVTDTANDIVVTYTGILPDLFREGKGVVAQGKIGQDRRFVATEVLAKHDENYMPPEAQHAVDQAEKAAKTLK